MRHLIPRTSPVPPITSARTAGPAGSGDGEGSTGLVPALRDASAPRPADAARRCETSTARPSEAAAHAQQPAGARRIGHHARSLLRLTRAAWAS